MLYRLPKSQLCRRRCQLLDAVLIPPPVKLLGPIKLQLVIGVMAVWLQLVVIDCCCWLTLEPLTIWPVADEQQEEVEDEALDELGADTSELELEMAPDEDEEELEVKMEEDLRRWWRAASRLRMSVAAGGSSSSFSSAL